MKNNLQFTKSKLLMRLKVLFAIWSKVVLFLFLFRSSSYAQRPSETEACIDNNTIAIMAPVCSGRGIFLKGSTPSGGNGTYSYIWEVNADGNCGNNGFVEVPGANKKDYEIPLSADPKTCYRRIVVSGDCRVESNKINTNGQTGNTPVVPSVVVTQPTCSVTTGTITVEPPVPAIGFSINGVDYNNTNGVFKNLAPNAYTVTVLYANDCKSPDVQVTIEAPPSLPSGVVSRASASICGNGAVILTVTGGSAFQWYKDGSIISGAVGNTYKATVIGTYTADIISGNCKGQASNSAVITAGTSPSGGISPTTAKVCTGGSTILSITGGSSYEWYKDGILITGATGDTYTVTTAGTYSAVIINNGCRGEATNAVSVTLQSCNPSNEIKVFVPTAFTPNKNGENDLLQPYLLNIQQLVQFKVYNRWGQTVFQTTEIGKGWDGTIKGEVQPAETYSWILECIDVNGKTIKQSGRSLLIR